MLLEYGSREARVVRDMLRLAITGVAAGVLVLATGLSCIGSGDNAASATGKSSGRVSDAKRDFPLDSLATSTVTINGHTIRVWLARTSDEHAEGLMQVPESEIEDDQGMLFVFEDEAQRGFWMKNTITSLDIAFARMDGKIVAIWTMPPLTLETFPSLEPAMFALEVKAGTFKRLGVGEGDKMVIPEGVFKP